MTKVRYRLVVAFLTVLCGVLVASRSEAYPWMIRHEYTGCASCHADPSGAGLITAYGRAQGYLLLPTKYGGSAEEDPGRMAQFLFGAIPLPDTLLLQIAGRLCTIPFFSKNPCLETL